jgi:selenocysteine lyase/cysteine desulfurase
VLPSQRELFGIPEDVAYFNCASLAPLMLPAREAGRRALELRATPWHVTAADWFTETERRRSLFAQLVGISPDNVALVPATSYGLAVAARNLAASGGQRVLVIAEDYPSNVYTWRTFCARWRCELLTVRRDPDEDWTSAIVGALDERVAIAALPNVHWTDGSLIDLPLVATKARAVGAHLVVDASQSLGAMPFDFASVRPDFLVAVGYKWLLGPFGLGYLYVSEQHLDGRPLEENWISREGSDNFANLVKYTDKYQPGARRFDVGQHTHFEVTPVAIAVLERLIAWGIPAIASTLAATTERIARGADAMGVALSSRGRRCGHMLGLTLPKATLAAAPGFLKKSGVYAGVRGATLRISPHVYTESADVDRLMQALDQLIDCSPGELRPARRDSAVLYS